MRAGRSLLAGAILLVAGSALAQQQEEINNAPYANGVAFKTPILQGQGDFILMLDYIGSTGTQNGVHVLAEQTHGYAAGSYYQLATPVVFFEASHGSPDLQRRFDLYGAYISYANSDGRKYGSFRVRMFSRVSGVDQAAFKDWTFSINGPLVGQDGQLNFDELNENLVGGFDSLGGKLDSLNQSIGAPNWWVQLVGPTQEGVDEFMACIDQLRTWGPLNVYQELVDLFGSYPEPDYENVFLGVATVDFSFWETPLKFIRGIVGGVFWITGVFFVWTKFLQKA